MGAVVKIIHCNNTQKSEKANLGWWQEKEKKHQEQVEKQNGILVIFIWLYAFNRSLSLIKILKISTLDLSGTMSTIWVVSLKTSG